MKKFKILSILMLFFIMANSGSVLAMNYSVDNYDDFFEKDMNDSKYDSYDYFYGDENVKQVQNEEYIQSTKKNITEIKTINIDKNEKKEVKEDKREEDKREEEKRENEEKEEFKNKGQAIKQNEETTEETKEPKEEQEPINKIIEPEDMTQDKTIEKNEEITPKDYTNQLDENELKLFRKLKKNIRKQNGTLRNFKKGFIERVSCSDEFDKPYFNGTDRNKYLECLENVIHECMLYVHIGKVLSENGLGVVKSIKFPSNNEYAIINPFTGEKDGKILRGIYDFSSEELLASGALLKNYLERLTSHICKQKGSIDSLLAYHLRFFYIFLYHEDGFSKENNYKILVENLLEYMKGKDKDLYELLSKVSGGEDNLVEFILKIMPLKKYKDKLDEIIYGESYLGTPVNNENLIENNVKDYDVMLIYTVKVPDLYVKGKKICSELEDLFYKYFKIFFDEYSKQDIKNFENYSHYGLLSHGFSRFLNYGKVLLIFLKRKEIKGNSKDKLEFFKFIEDFENIDKFRNSFIFRVQKTVYEAAMSACFYLDNLKDSGKLKDTIINNNKNKLLSRDFISDAELEAFFNSFMFSNFVLPNIAHEFDNISKNFDKFDKQNIDLFFEKYDKQDEILNKNRKYNPLVVSWVGDVDSCFDLDLEVKNKSTEYDENRIIFEIVKLITVYMWYYDIEKGLSEKKIPAEIELKKGMEGYLLFVFPKIQDESSNIATKMENLFEPFYRAGSEIFSSLGQRIKKEIKNSNQNNSGGKRGKNKTAKSKTTSNIISKFKQYLTSAYEILKKHGIKNNIELEKILEQDLKKVYTDITAHKKEIFDKIQFSSRFINF